MAGSLNKVMLIGALGKDPEIRTLNSGDRVANLRIATSESWKDRHTGEKKEKTEWHQVVIFNEHIVKVCENYLTKGAKVYLEGALQTRKWTDQQGVEKYSTEIILQKFNGTLTMLSSPNRDGDGAVRNGGGGGDGDYGRASGAGYGGGYSGARQGTGPKESFVADLDDDIPFARRESVW